MPKQNIRQLIDKSDQFQTLVDYDGQNREEILRLLKHLVKVSDILKGRELDFLKNKLREIVDGH